MTTITCVGDLLGFLEKQDRAIPVKTVDSGDVVLARYECDPRRLVILDVTDPEDYETEIKDLKQELEDANEDISKMEDEIIDLKSIRDSLTEKLDKIKREASLP